MLNFVNFSVATILFINSVSSQGLNDCFYRIGGAELDLREYKGFTFRYEGNDGFYYYSPCTNQLVCERDGVVRYEMADRFPAGVEECLGIARFDELIQPRYDPFVSSWFFNYTSDELCPDANLNQANRSSLFAWTCNEDAEFPFIADINHYDACNDYVEIQFIGACIPAPPINQDCVFKDAGRTLNLSTIAGQNLKFMDQYNNTVVYSPCANNFKCQTSFGVANNMAEIIDHSNSQCLKYLAIFSGDAQAYYDRTIIGQDYWEFYWINGEQCGEGGPNEILNIRYYCNANATETTITSFGQEGPPCNFRMDIDSPLACV